MPVMMVINSCHVWWEEEDLISDRVLIVKSFRQRHSRHQKLLAVLGAILLSK
jgi:type II secretory pathway component PulM